MISTWMLAQPLPSKTPLPKWKPQNSCFLEFQAVTLGSRFSSHFALCQVRWNDLSYCVCYIILHQSDSGLLHRYQQAIFWQSVYQHTSLKRKHFLAPHSKKKKIITRKIQVTLIDRSLSIDKLLSDIGYIETLQIICLLILYIRVHVLPGTTLNTHPRHINWAYATPTGPFLS